MIEAIILGALAGASYGVIKFYNKKQKAKDEMRNYKLDFQKGKFAKTLLIGAVIGGIAGYGGLSIEVAFGNEMLYFGAIVAVEEIYKLVHRLLQHKGIL